MILSMTGFGRGVCIFLLQKITIEIKSLNSKQFDLTMRVPSYFKEIEVEARNYIGSRMERGKTDLSASVEYVGDETPVQINEAVVSNYKRQIEEPRHKTGYRRAAGLVRSSYAYARHVKERCVRCRKG